MNTLSGYLFVGAVLLVIGLYGVTVRRNMLSVLKLPVPVVKAVVSWVSKHLQKRIVCQCQT